MPALAGPQMTDRLRIALAQLNPMVGALAANLELGRKALAEAVAAGADILLLPELFLTGYFPEDLLLKPQFIADAVAAARELAAATRGTKVSLLLPTVWQEGGQLYNAVVLAEDGEIVATRTKRELPNDDVFFEKRYFVSGPLAEPLTIKGVSIGVPICEDIWRREVCAHLVDNGARLLLCPNGSPWWRNKQDTRKRLVNDRVRENDVPMLYLNQIGGQDELVYDGASFAIEPGGRLALQGRSFEPDFIVSDWHDSDNGWRCVDGVVRDLPSARLRARPARLRPQERLPHRRARALGRHRQRRRGGHGDRCPGCRERALPDAALSLHLGGEHCRRKGVRRPAGGAP